MAKHGKAGARPKAEAWSRLTWEDLDDWAGSRTVSRGKSYQRNRCVSELGVSGKGILLATVEGTWTYATQVELDTGRRKRSERIVSKCSCPVGLACKHAVAVVIEYCMAIEDGSVVANASEDDRRWAVIERRLNPDEMDDREWYGDENTNCDSRETSSRAAPSRRGSKRRKISDSDIQSHLESMSQGELVQRIMQISGHDSDVRKALADEVALAGGRFDELLHEAREEVRSLTAEPAWRNHWDEEGELPDYSGLQKRLQMLLDHGLADGVVDIGQELIRRGMEQVAQSDDNGETVGEIAECLGVVCRGLVKSSRSDADKILFAINSLLLDDYGICQAFNSVLERRWKKAAWSETADRLQERLMKSPEVTSAGDWSSRYRRERLSDWVIQCLDSASRAEDASNLCVAEAHGAGSYTRAVQRLINEKEYARAKELAEEGIHKTPARSIGIVHELQDLLCEIAAKDRDWMLPAGVAADRFFSQPSVSSYKELLKAARKAKCEPTVRKAALDFLETGERPDSMAKRKAKRSSANPWPLPQPPQPVDKNAAGRFRQSRQGPYFSVLIDLAIQEKRPDDVLRWFDCRKAPGGSTSLSCQDGISRADARIAEAVAESHPERAIEIYRQLADSIAAETNTKTYSEAGRCLKRIKPLLNQVGRADEWAEIIAEFRSRHGRKRRLMEVIDRLEDQRISKRSRD